MLDRSIADCKTMANHATAKKCDAAGTSTPKATKDVTRGANNLLIEKIMEMVVCESLAEITYRVSGRWPIIVVMTIKGNLRHRIAKLGSEKEWEELTGAQKILRKIAISQDCKEVISGHHERPSWGGGAFYYCEKEHLTLFREVMHRLPFPCQSKHVICSEAYLDSVRECIASTAPVPGRGREAFLIKRAGQIRQFDIVELPTCPMLNVDQLYGNKFDADLILHMALKPSVQASYPEEWENVWGQVYENESSILKPINPNNTNTFTCRFCGGRALMNAQHALFAPCSAKIRNAMIKGSLFNAIYGLAEEFPPRVLRVNDLSKIEEKEEEAKGITKDADIDDTGHCTSDGEEE